MILTIIFITLIIITITAFADIFISFYTKKFSSSDVSHLPTTDNALILGTAKYVGEKSKINRYYQYRIDAAVELWKAKSVQRFIVSGSGINIIPSETECMQADLVEAGIPEEIIWQDTAGLRTLDSILRFKDKFKNESLCIVSQPFHNQRAIIQAKFYKIDTYAYNTEVVGIRSGWKVHLRERFARIKLWLDLIFCKKTQYSIEEIDIKQYHTEARIAPITPLHINN